MKRAKFTVVVLSALMLSGCAVSDVIYGVFSQGYAGGGPTEIDKRRHYDQQVETSQRYERQADSSGHYSPW